MNNTSWEHSHEDRMICIPGLMIALLVVGFLGLTLFLADLGVANAADGDQIPTSTTAECEPDVEQFPEKDSDGDGLNDAAETDGLEIGVSGVFVKTDPCEKDSDDDDLTDSEELRGRGPGGGLLDDLREQVGEAITNPIKSDTDNDGLKDGEEFVQYTIVLDGGNAGKKITVISNPTKSDTDGDGLNDKIERQGWSIKVNGEHRHVKSSPLSSDTDGDGLTDKEEYDGLISRWGTVKTDPTHTDTDGDEITDGVEINGTVIPGEMILLNPTRKDSDEDGIDDRKEVDDPKCDAGRVDTDGDGIADRISSTGVTVCGSYDQDRDGLPDHIEKNLGLDPNSPDTDGDGLDDLTEIRGSTSPNKSDTDGDGKFDGKDEAPNSSFEMLSDAAKKPSDTSTVEELHSKIGSLEVTLREKNDLLDEKTDLLAENGELIEQYKKNLRGYQTQNESSGSQETGGQDTGTRSSSLISLMFVVVAGGIALILGLGIGYVIWNRPGATDHILRQQAVENLRSDPDLRRQLAGEIRQEPAFVGQVRQEITNQLNQERGNRLQGTQSDLRNRLDSTRTELRGAVAATNRGIPEAMLQEAEALISPDSDNNRWAENLAVASSLIRNVARYYLGHNPST